MKPEIIVAAVDFSESSLLAMETAFNLFCEEGGEVHLLHILDVPFGVDPMGVLQPSIEELRLEAVERLESLIPQNLARATRVKRVVIQGTPASAIAEYANEQDADIIVVGTHGRTGLARVILGSTAEALLRHAPCQVLVVKPKHTRHPVDEPESEYQASAE